MCVYKIHLRSFCLQSVIDDFGKILKLELYGGDLKPVQYGEEATIIGSAAGLENHDESVKLLF